MLVAQRECHAWANHEQEHVNVKERGCVFKPFKADWATSMLSASAFPEGRIRHTHSQRDNKTYHIDGVIGPLLKERSIGVGTNNCFHPEQLRLLRVTDEPR